MNKNISWLKNNMFAHRGLHNEYYPENSISSFIHAMKYGYGIELDVQLTKDNKVIVFHDYNLSRMTGIDEEVSSLTYEEISKLHLLDTNEKIPLLQDVLDLVNKKTPIIVDMKSTLEYIELSESVYNICKEYEGEYSVQSFDPRVINWYNNNAKDVILGKISYNILYKITKLYKQMIRSSRHLNIKNTYDYICASINGINSIKIFLHRKKMPVLSWTIKNKEQMKKAYKYADSIIFEDFMPVNINKKG